MSGYVQSNYVVSMPPANQTLSAADSGKIFLLPDLAAARTITLPALSPGLHYMFLNAAMAAAFNWIITSGGNNNIGVIVDVGGVGTSLAATIKTAAAAGGNINFIGGTSVIGDSVEIYSCGTKWSVRAVTGAAGGITAS